MEIIMMSSFHYHYYNSNFVSWEMHRGNYNGIGVSGHNRDKQSYVSWYFYKWYEKDDENEGLPSSDVTQKSIVCTFSILYF